MGEKPVSTECAAAKRKRAEGSGPVSAREAECLLQTPFTETPGRRVTWSLVLIWAFILPFLEAFLTEHDRVIEFLKVNPSTIVCRPITKTKREQRSARS